MHALVSSVWALQAVRRASIFSRDEASEQNVLTKSMDLLRPSSVSTNPSLSEEDNVLGRDAANSFGTTVEEGLGHRRLVGRLRAAVEGKVGRLVRHLDERVGGEAVLCRFRKMSGLIGGSQEKDARVMAFLPYPSNSSATASFWQMRSLRRVSANRCRTSSSARAFREPGRSRDSPPPS